jgi:hypothetical protein
LNTLAILKQNDKIPAMNCFCFLSFFCLVEKAKIKWTQAQRMPNPIWNHYLYVIISLSLQKIIYEMFPPSLLAYDFQKTFMKCFLSPSLPPPPNHTPTPTKPADGPKPPYIANDTVSPPPHPPTPTSNNAPTKTDTHTQAFDIPMPLRPTPAQKIPTILLIDNKYREMLLFTPQSHYANVAWANSPSVLGSTHVMWCDA